jgi:hypothetical protein
MPRKPARKPDNPEQFKRFVATARQLGADQPNENVDRVLKKVARQNPGRDVPKKAR